MRRALVAGSERLDSPGGMEAVCREEVRALTSAGLDTSYVASAHVARGRAFPRTFGPLVEVARLRRWGQECGVVDVLISNGPVGWGLRGRSISAHFYHGTYAGQAAAVGSDISRLGHLKLRLLDAQVLERNAGRGKRCLANSTTTAEEVAKYFGWDARIVGCPVDTDVFRPADEDRVGLVGRRPRGVFVGSGRPMKGERVAYDVMRNTLDVDWIVVGDQPLANIPQNAQRIDRLDHSSMPSFLRSADILLTTPVYEPFGLVIAEALAVGTPVVSSPAGAADMLLVEPDVRHWYVPDRLDVIALTDAVLRVLSHRAAARKAAIGVRDRIERTIATKSWHAAFLAALDLQPPD
jgi:glycosyltransferase involved in cell wall biosynthesis